MSASPTTSDSPPLTPKHQWAALSVLVLAILLLAVDGTVLYLAVPSLTTALSPSATQVLWIGDIYSLAVGGLLVVMGNLADRIGRKLLLLIGSAAFGAASLLAAYAPNAELLIAARFLLGVSGATLMPSTLSIIRNIFPNPTQRSQAIAIWAAAAGGGVALGPLVGGALLEHFWWGSVFLINVPVTIVLVIAGSLLLPESRNPKPGSFDLLSAVLSMAATMPLVYALKHAAAHGPDLIAAACLGAAILAGSWFWRRQRHLRDPLMEVRLFTRPAFTGAVFANFVSVFALTGLLFFFSQYLQLVRGFTPLQAGLAELPAALASIVVVALVAPAIRRLGVGGTIAAGLALSAVGLALVAASEGAASYLWLGLSLVPVGLGVGLAETATTDAVVSAAPPAKAGAASAISETAYELGVAFGIAVLGSLLTVLYRNAAPTVAGLGPTEQTKVNDSLAGAVATLEPDSAALQSAQEAFTIAMQFTSLTAAAVTLLAATIAWRVIPSRPDTATDPADHTPAKQPKTAPIGAGQTC